MFYLRLDTPEFDGNVVRARHSQGSRHSGHRIFATGWTKPTMANTVLATRHPKTIS